MIPSGTPLPSAASIRAADRADRKQYYMGVVRRFVRDDPKKGRIFLCELPDLDRPGLAQWKVEISECDIELLDMPVEGWPEEGNVAP